MEAKMDEEMEVYVDPITGKTYLRTKSGTLKGNKISSYEQGCLQSGH